MVNSKVENLDAKDEGEAEAEEEGYESKEGVIATPTEDQNRRPGVTFMSRLDGTRMPNDPRELKQ